MACDDMLRTPVLQWRGATGVDVAGEELEWRPMRELAGIPRRGSRELSAHRGALSGFPDSFPGLRIGLSCFTRDGMVSSVRAARRRKIIASIRTSYRLRHAGARALVQIAPIPVSYCSHLAFPRNRMLHV